MRRRRLDGLAILLLLAVPACGGRQDSALASRPAAPAEEQPTAPVGDPGTGAAVGSAAVAAARARAAADERPLVVFLGDSLSAGLGVDADQAFPAVVGERLAARSLPVRIVNAGLSGDTSAGGRERLDWFLRQDPDIVVVELGANDALRGQPLAGIEENLRDIVRRAQASGARVVLAGMRIPTNYGPDYSEGFAAIFPRVARDTGAALVPFLLQGVGGVSRLNQADGIHPTAEGQAILAGNVVEVLAPLVAAERAEG